MLLVLMLGFTWIWVKNLREKVVYGLCVSLGLVSKLGMSLWVHFEMVTVLGLLDFKNEYNFLWKCVLLEYGSSLKLWALKILEFA